MKRTHTHTHTHTHFTSLLDLTPFRKLSTFTGCFFFFFPAARPGQREQTGLMSGFGAWPVDQRTFSLTYSPNLSRNGEWRAQESPPGGAKHSVKEHAQSTPCPPFKETHCRVSVQRGEASFLCFWVDIHVQKTLILRVYTNHIPGLQGFSTMPLHQVF